MADKRGEKLNMNTSAVEREKAVEYVSDCVRVKVVYPDNIPETIRQHKINKMYDIFIGAMRRSRTKETAENPV
ncbi:MAG: hypothetical protein NC177_17300 [Ruminococcus flavefaciens]|nr:hypothetical protein [Ruminococcus flavefaciens]